MPRTARASKGNWCYHVLNRGNARAEVFHKPEDYAAFARLLGLASERVPMRLLAWCALPNHFHLVLWPRGDGDLGRWMQWLTTSHVRRYHRDHGGSGHVWQGRYKAFPIQRDEHLLTVMRYVERNPVRAGLTTRSVAWPWSSAGDRVGKPIDDAPPLATSPVPLPGNWPRLIDRPQTEAEEQALRDCIARGAPFGSPQWRQIAARRLGLEFTLRPRGRPRKPQK